MTGTCGPGNGKNQPRQGGPAAWRDEVRVSREMVGEESQMDVCMSEDE